MQAGDGAAARAGGEGANRRVERPSLHSQIIAGIEAKILGGEWPPGHRIPFEHQLTESTAARA